MSRRVILHPWLLGAFPCLSVYSQNVGYTPVTKLLQTLLIVELSVTVLWFTTYLFVRQSNRTSLFVSLLVATTFAFGPLSSLFQSHGPSAIAAHHQRTALMVELLIFVAGAVSIRRARSALHSWARVASAFAVALVAVSAVSVISHALRVESHRTGPLSTMPRIALSASSPEQLPDIYYIVPDAYGRSDVLRDVYGFDNRPFIEHLRSEGFFVADSSFSNYARTILSIPSTLNMEYMNVLFGGPVPNPISSDRIAKLCAKSRLVQALKEQLGYEFIAFSSGTRWTECKSADEYLNPKYNLKLGEFGHAVLGLTPLPFLADRLLRVSPAKWHRERILFTLEELPTIVNNPNPTFTFAHVLCPHTPFIFDEHGGDAAIPGEPVRFEMLERDLFESGDPRDIAAAAATYRRRYRQQATYMTHRLDQVIGSILRDSPNPVIIVLQSDHGPSSPSPVEANRFWENFANLIAVYAPALPSPPDDLSPVNTFRFILDQVFGANLELLPNDYYWYDGRRVERRGFVPYEVQNPEATGDDVHTEHSSEVDDRDVLGRRSLAMQPNPR